MSATATVKIQVSVRLCQPWDNADSIKNIIPRAKAEALSTVLKALENYSHSMSIIGEPIVETIIKVD